MEVTAASEASLIMVTLNGEQIGAWSPCITLHDPCTGSNHRVTRPVDVSLCEQVIEMKSPGHTVSTSPDDSGVMVML